MESACNKNSQHTQYELEATSKWGICDGIEKRGQNLCKTDVVYPVASSRRETVCVVGYRAQAHPRSMSEDLSIIPLDRKNAVIQATVQVLEGSGSQIWRAKTEGDEDQHGDE